MSKAFQCENCLECFPGAAHHITKAGNEICSGCHRALEALAGSDPLDVPARIKLRHDTGVSWQHCECPLHTGRHSQ